MIALGVANSSVLIVLERVRRLALLEESFKEILIPPAVAREVGEVPAFVSVVPVPNPSALKVFPSRVHKGEAEVIMLGMCRPGAVLLLDDWYARSFAQQRGLAVIGTVGLIVRAKRIGMLPSVSPLLQELSEAGFRLSPQVLAEARRIAGE